MKFILAAILLVSLLHCALTASVSLQIQNPTGAHLQFQQKPTFEITVTPATATGTVNILVDGTNYGSPYGSCQLSAGFCNVTVLNGQNFDVGTHTAVAMYLGDAANPTANSSAVSFQVYAITILTLTSNPSGFVAAGAPVTLTVSTSNQGTSTTPTGTISFVDVSHAGAIVGTCTITGVSSCNTILSGLSGPQNYTFTATYMGDNVYDQAAAPSIRLEVGAGTTTQTTTTTTSTTSGTTATSTSTSTTSATSTSTTASSSGNSTSTATSSTGTSTSGTSTTTSTPTSTTSTPVTSTSTGKVTTSGSTTTPTTATASSTTQTTTATTTPTTGTAAGKTATTTTTTTATGPTTAATSTSGASSVVAFATGSIILGLALMC